MQAIFDNKTNILNANLRATYDGHAIYTVRSSSGFRGRNITILEDANPLDNDQPYDRVVSRRKTRATHIVGAIHWKERILEVHGHRKPLADIKRREGGMFSKTRLWQWSKDRPAYEIRHQHDEWTASPDSGMSIAGRFSVPFRPHLFTKSKPAELHLTQAALTSDEVFLILAFIYSEAKRQERTNIAPVDD
ncbi:hypothetical protein HGRIS_001704 [Hohenbuehelia grisea]|uniref:Uncharacterized protein n=1 Tax=Hohenbuehelia grisea TaxID=104357 RepID=A0ABR3JJH4_9AGAR